MLAKFLVLNMLFVLIMVGFNTFVDPNPFVLFAEQEVWKESMSVLKAFVVANIAILIFLPIV